MPGSDPIRPGADGSDTVGTGDDLPQFRPVGEAVLQRGWAITFNRVDIVGPDGVAFDRDVVRHPGAVAVVAVTPERSVVLVQQYRAAADRWLLEIPAGTRDVAGEDERVTASRELAEEAGYAATDLTLLARCLMTPGFCDQVTSVYLATGLDPVATDRHGIEEDVMRIVEVPLDRFDGMVDDGTIVDATTILGVGLATRRLSALRA